jgi:spore maturation protein CgeB
MSQRIIIAGETGNHCLEMSYQQALKQAGHEVALFDTQRAVHKYARLGKLGKQLHRFFPVEAWLRKANKEFAEYVKAYNPDIIVLFTGAETLPGTIAYIKSILPVRIAWYWADPLPNLSRYIHQSLPLVDLVASYSRSSLNVFEQMGAQRTLWLPFAGDKEAHYMPAAPRKDYLYDVAFVGSWRPEREAALQTIYEHFPQLRFKISGPYWDRCQFAPLKKIAGSAPLYGKAFTEVMQNSRLNLNVMDNTNYPSVNMRFFEILTAGGAQLCSAGPEMEDVFKPNEHLLYFSNAVSLVEKVNFALNNPQDIENIKFKGQQLLLSDHLYQHRAAALLSAVEQIKQ